MAKQKGGLHKQIGAIFDGIPNPAETEDGSGIGQQAMSTRSGSYFRSDVMDSDDVLQQHNEVAPQPKVPSERKPAPVITKSQSTPQPVNPKPSIAVNRGVMLPASLTSKSLGMSIKDKIKLKIDEIVERGDKRQMVMMVLIPVLFIILIAVFYNLLKTPGTERSTPDTTVQAVQTLTANTEIVWPKIEPFPETLRDPMSEKALIAGKRGYGGLLDPSNIKVNGILFDIEAPATSKAIINGQQAGIGDDISGVKIKDITSKYVEFEIDQKVWKQSVGF